MTTPTTTTPRKTALNGVHRALGAKMVDFAGWDMPVEYAGIIKEHRAVRTAAGLFDVSHMGEIEVRGPQALALVQQATCNNAAKLKTGQAQYSALLTERGTFVDDLLVHKLADDHYLLCVNAANREKDFEHIRGQNRFEAEAQNTGDDYTQLALQGPQAAELLAPHVALDLAELKTYRFTRGKACGAEAIIARTGYTGEDGFELYFDPAESEKVWTTLLEAGKPKGLVPCGLGARNTLRLEVCYPLYGHEIDDTTTVWEAELAWICKLDKGEFTGRQELLEQKKKGVARKLVGFEMRARGIARDGYPVLIDGQETGRVTSGSFLPYVEKNAGLAYVPVDKSAAGTRLEIALRGNRRAAAEIVPTPFYRRPR